MKKGGKITFLCLDNQLCRHAAFDLCFFPRVIYSWVPRFGDSPQAPTRRFQTSRTWAIAMLLFRAHTKSLQSEAQTIRMESACCNRDSGKFPCSILKFFNLSIALSTWIRTLAIRLVDVTAFLDNCFPPMRQNSKLILFTHMYHI